MLNNQGQVLLIVAMIMALASAYTLIMIDKSVHATKINKAINDEKAALWLAEAGVEKAVWCLNQTAGTNCGGTFGASYIGESNMNLGNGTVTTTVSGDTTSKTVIAVGHSSGGQTKTVHIGASSAPGTVTQSGFDFAVQATGGGVTLSNNAQINDGPTYSDADIVCSNHAETERDVYVSKSGGKIDGCENIRDAHADKVLNSQVSRNAYYKNNPADISGTTVGGTKYPGSATPTPRGLPVFDLDFWHAAAEAGGTITGNYSPPNGSTLGPKKINGNLTIDGVTVTITGPVWVAGNIILTNGANLRLSLDFGSASGVLLADNPANRANSGLVIINNNATITRSPVDGSYIFFVSTNTRTDQWSPAINIGNNVDGGVFYATSGCATVNNNGLATAVAGYKVYLANNTFVNYDNTGQTPVSMKLATTKAGPWRPVQGSRSE